MGPYSQLEQGYGLHTFILCCSRRPCSLHVGTDTCCWGWPGTVWCIYLSSTRKFTVYPKQEKISSNKEDFVAKQQLGLQPPYKGMFQAQGTDLAILGSGDRLYNGYFLRRAHHCVHNFISESSVTWSHQTVRAGGKYSIASCICFLLLL